jgi:DNA-binding transcriptional LysR family regulator
MNTNKLMAMLPDMAVLVLVIESGSFSAAAKTLNMSPSAVSRQISRLEHALDVTLLERTTRKQSPTEEGLLAYEKCRVLVDCAQDVSQIASRRLTVEGDIRIAAPKAYSKHILQPLIHEFLALHPLVNIHFKVTDEFLNPQRDDVDLAVRLSHSLIEGLVSKPLHPIESVLCATHHYLKAQGIPKTPNDLKQHSCITLGQSKEELCWIFEKDAKRIQMNVRGRYTNNHSEMRLAAISEHLGIGIFPSFVVEDAIRKKLVVQVLSDWTLRSKYQGVASLQFSKNKYMPARLRVFIDFLTENLAV